MRKIFIKHFLIIMVITVMLTIIGNSIIQTIFTQRTADKTAERIIHSISERIHNNNLAIEDITNNLNEHYIARAHGFAEIIKQNPDVILDQDEMQRISNVLKVDEVHVTDENGILRWGNVKEYYGIDFAATEQTRPFMPALTDKSFELAQAPQPNGMEGKLFQYISVARQDRPGIVQVGVGPQILENSLANNKIEFVISSYNTSEGENVIAIDKTTGIVVSASKEKNIGKHYSAIGIPHSFITLEENHTWPKLNGEYAYSVFDESDNYIIGVSFSAKNLFAQCLSQNIVTIVSSILLGLIIIISIFILLKRVIMTDIEEVNRDLACITHGKLDVVVSANATPELTVLSQAINEMVTSLNLQMAEITEQSAKLKEFNKNILASLNYARRIQNNLLPNIESFHKSFSDIWVLWEPKDQVSGDIYWVKDFQEGTVLCVCDCTGHGTPGALLTMLVVTALEAIVTIENYADPSEIMWELDQRLISTLNTTDSMSDIKDGADLAILYIHKNGNITMSSSNIHLFICNNTTVEKIKGQKLSIGEGTLTDKTQIHMVSIPYDENCKFYIATDGLFDQIGEKNGIPFGYKRFMQIILKNHPQSQQEITKKIWQEFQLYMGNENRRDDITLMSFKP